MNDHRPNIIPDAPLTVAARIGVVAAIIVLLGGWLMLSGCQSAGEAWILDGLGSPAGTLVEPGTESSAAGLSERSEFRPDAVALEPGIGLVVSGRPPISYSNKAPAHCRGRLDPTVRPWQSLGLDPYVYHAGNSEFLRLYELRYGGDRSCLDAGTVTGNSHGVLTYRVEALCEQGGGGIVTGNPQTHNCVATLREQRDLETAQQVWAQAIAPIATSPSAEPVCRLPGWSTEPVPGGEGTCDFPREGYWPCCWTDFVPGPFSQGEPGRYCAFVRGGGLDPRCMPKQEPPPPPDDPPPPPDDEEPPADPPPAAECDLSPVVQRQDALAVELQRLADALADRPPLVCPEPVCHPTPCRLDCDCPSPCPTVDCGDGGTEPPTDPPTDPPPPPPSESVDITADFLANSRKRTVPVPWSTSLVHVRVDANSSSRVDQQPNYPVSPAQVVFGCLRPAPDPKRGKGLCIIRQPDKKGARLDNGQNVSCGNEGGWQIDHRDGTISERCGRSLTYQATLAVVDDLAVDLSLDPKFETDGSGNPTAWFAPRSGNIRFRLTPVAQQRRGLVAEEEPFELPYVLWGVRWGEGVD